jgi:hypothetical protein
MRRLRKLIPVVCVFAAAVSLSACARWVLPSNSTTTDSPFQNYRSAEDAYNRITPYVTTVAELKSRGLNPYTAPNVKVLNYLDLVPRFLPQASMKQEDLDPAVRACLSARDSCTGWLAEPSVLASDRTGNVPLDMLGFDRTTTSTGWKASMLLLIQNGVVVYKLWSGTPSIIETKRDTKPLGPLQDLSGAAAGAVAGAIKP